MGIQSLRFQHCRPVIIVNETHLYAKYEHKLLMIVVIDGNHSVLPVAYALVDEEMTESWRWFLHNLDRHVVKNWDDVYLISDRHPGINLKWFYHYDDQY